MKLRWWYGIAVNLVLAALVISGAVFYTAYSRSKNQFLEITDANSGKLYRKWRLKETGEFAIEFIHSVHQSPVKETYKIENNMIKPVAVRFFSFGAGMQSDLEEGQVLSREGDALLITGFNNSFEELNYIVGTVSDHLLLIKDETISLQKLCGKNAHITVRFHKGRK